MHRTPSEVQLAQLHLSYTEQAPSNQVLGGNASVADSFAESAITALQHLAVSEGPTSPLATPPSSSCTGLLYPDAFSPVDRRSPVPDINGEDPFFSTRALYHDGESPWLSHHTQQGASPSGSNSSAAPSSEASGIFDDDDDNNDSNDSYFPSAPSSYTSGLLSRSNSSSSKSKHTEVAPVDTSLAARRGKPMSCALPPRKEITQADFDAVQALARSGPRQQCTQFKFGSPPKPTAADAFEQQWRAKVAGTGKDGDSAAVSPDVADFGVTLKRRPTRSGFAF